MQSFRSAALTLWLRLMALAIVGLVFADALYLGSNKVQGWTFYLTTSEVVFEVGLRLVVGALAGMILGTLCTALLMPFIWRFQNRRDSLLAWTTGAGVVLVAFVDSRLALTTLIKSSHRGVRVTTALLIAHFILFVISLLLPRLRRELTSSLDVFLGPNASRAMAFATVIGFVALVIGEFALSRPAQPVKAAVLFPNPKPNILLITFDALDAEDLSFYGRALPTTPNLDAFASKSTVFTNSYSGSTFTTSGIATLLTGQYPSETRVYQVQGILRGENRERTLPQALRAGGYTTAAFLSNPWAYYLAKTGRDGFEVLPEPNFEQGGVQRDGVQRLWSATRLLHQDTGVGSRVDEYFDLENLWNELGLPHSHSFQFRPDASFEQAREVLSKLPDGFFFWVHVITPHDPYIPDPADQGRFLPYAEQRTFQDESVASWRPHYDASRQSQIDRRRLLYDEFVATADRAFGSFISELENSGRLKDTTVIVSADHGESFEGGIYRHETPDQTRPVIHIPLIIRTPGQQQGRKITYVADQTAIAPTVLDLTGVAKPAWMRAQSLAPVLKGEATSNGQGIAFAEFLEKNSVFKPLRH